MKEVISKDDSLVLQSLAEQIIEQTHYELLSSLSQKSLDLHEQEIQASNVTCLFHIPELVFARNEGSQERFTTVLNALHACEATCILLLQCQNGHSDLYIGAVNKKRYDNVFYLNTIRDVLRSSIEGNLPGTELHEIVERDRIQEKIRSCLDNGFDSQCISAISSVPSDIERGETDGIERLLEAIGNRNFTIMVLADPVDPLQMKGVRRGYEELATQLSQLEQTSISLQYNTSEADGINYSESFSKSIGTNISLTQSHTTGTGWSTARDDPEAKRSKLLAAGVGIATASPMLMTGMSAILMKPQSTDSGHEDHTTGISSGYNEGQQQGQQFGRSRQTTVSEGTSYTFSQKNRHVKELIDRVEWFLGWLNSRENYGMFNSATYVISSSAGTNLMIASQYQALMQGENEMNQPMSINTWTRENGVEGIRTSLMHFTHPRLVLEKVENQFTPAMLMSGRELSRQMALPQRSVVGVTVSEYAAFGREVVRKSPMQHGKIIRIGCISHMGKSLPNQPVILDLQSMAAHTFIAGTNGSGKSNTVFRILEELMRVKIPFLVIEPAKGEYKNVFGMEPDVHVYGTNQRKTGLLRLNPFWFNEDVDVLEHIDKLTAVFSASWSMYAAMPAVLKAAIENAYRSCGWDLKKSICKGGCRIFPTVADVLTEFNSKMSSTAFSEEVKGNYVGALSTRMESLTNGIYGEIFGGGNLTDEELFCSNVIIDLSRVGSAETKSMLMGMMVIRLQEYRAMTEATNQPLRHVTVLEEAHHLLRATSTAQSDEGSNMLGKSVEMLSNAIAEMRSYGEGFMIVDQSPGLLDMSVMRNTNTKIILRLPESGDREIVGKTIGLTSEQIFELSRLKTGDSAVYQKDWLEAVLCRVDRAGHETQLYVSPAADDGELKRKGRILEVLLAPYLQKTAPAEECAAFQQLVLDCRFPGKLKRTLLQMYQFYPELGACSELYPVLRQIAALELELPERREESYLAHWYKQQIAEQELLQVLSPDAAELLLRQEMKTLAGEDPAWRLLPAETQAASALMEARGRAFCAVTPWKQGRKKQAAPEQEMLRSDAAILKDADEADRKLAELLTEYLQSGSTRERGMLLPYTRIVWELLNGSTAWEAAYPMLQQKQITEWDRYMREHVRRAVTAGAETESELLSLLLQHQGTDKNVKEFYPKWHHYAMKLR